MNPITVSVIVRADLFTVWACWNEPAHIMQWAFASPEWEAPHAEQDLRVGGTFVTTMAAKDQSASFDFAGTYTEVVPHERIAYVMADGRKVEIVFEQTDEGTKVTETFDPETENAPEFQQAGWQAILENFKIHTEAQ